MKYKFNDLVDIVSKLRAPGGCPWDAVQTHESIKKNVVEEAYELVEAIDGGDSKKIADESGDMLLQVVFHAIIGSDNGEYDIDDVSDAICRKLIHRHPHVFGDVEVKNAEEVLENWDAIKRNDRDQSTITDELKGVSAYLPALMRCEKIQKKAAKAGYETTVNPKLQSSIIEEDTKHNIIEGKLGKALFDIVEICRKNDIEPELLLNRQIQLFINDFHEFEIKNKGAEKL
ncbi:MAG: nucleoside triphosphate pyrophosphohydrolase [Oscillospiraceae bacterium]